MFIIKYLYKEYHYSSEYLSSYDMDNTLNALCLLLLEEIRLRTVV